MRPLIRLSLFACLLLAFLSASALAQQKSPSGYHVVKQYKLGGDGGWDYITYDAKGNRVFISRSTHVMVVDADSGNVVGDIPDTQGVHGIAIADEFGKGYTSNGRGNNVTVFDLYARYNTDPAAEPAAATVDPCPASLQYEGAIPSRIPARFVPYNGTGDAPRWLTEPPRRPRICVTWGTIHTILGGREGFLVPRILDALAGFDVEVVVALTAVDRPLLGDNLPERVRVTETLPLHLLLPSCDAIIHQGGASTMLTAASFGLPQLVVPRIVDQLANAERIAAAGAGVSLNYADASTETITAGIKTIVSDETTRQVAHNLRDEIHAQPAPAAIAARRDTASTRASAPSNPASTLSRSAARA